MSYSDASRSNKNFQPGFWDWAKRGHQTAQRSQLFNVYNGSSSSSLDRMELIDGLWRTHTYIHKKRVYTHTQSPERSGLVCCADTETNKYLVAGLRAREAVITAGTSNPIPEERVLILPCCTCVCIHHIICDYWWVNEGGECFTVSCNPIH